MFGFWTTMSYYSCEYYRLPDQILQISQVSKILLFMESVNLHDLKGKFLEEFDIFLMTENLSGSEDDDDATDFQFWSADIFLIK